eukprot:TRINITY_DN6762_c0_g1_i1.p1 TRINITY_DN6762_c0_g1~~TRINITY_DN6762_c0_g1_i1.p1  ORF type:complete len:388 (-),score=116.12 TRINITY_DN6762_c0_g1_i1:65-1228(-)
MDNKIIKDIERSRKISKKYNINEIEEKYVPISLFMNSKKKFLVELSYRDKNEEEEKDESLIFSRYDSIRYPSKFKTTNITKDVKLTKNYYLYDEEETFNGEENDIKNYNWHVNFADSELFGFFQNATFAQDEYQVQEHPCCCSLREVLKKESNMNQDLLPKTHESRESPCLIFNAQRRIHLDITEKSNNNNNENNNEDNQNLPGLYGRNFVEASEERIENATTILNPPTHTNIVAIAAPKGFSGTYTISQLTNILSISYSGFRAVYLDTHDIHFNNRLNNMSEDNVNEALSVTIHTGHWGCGAFGGNKVVMCMIQIIASVMAGCRLVYHTIDDESHELCEEALNNLEEYQNQLHPNKNDTNQLTFSVFSILQLIVDSGYKWGQSDGN